MTQLIDTPRLGALGASPEIMVFPGDRGWDAARQAWNLAVDQRPAAVALPTTVADVVAVVEYARELGLQIVVQGTGHGAVPRALDGTILINMSEMTGVELDLEARTARVAAGTQWLDVVEAAVPHGLTALHGSAKDVGVVGYTLGGGIGWLARKHGLASSSVLAAELVTATGDVVRADPETNPELFWAIRGGGGSFGVVTSIEIALLPVTETYSGWLMWPADRSTEVLGAWADWTRTAPEEVTSIGRLLQVPPIPQMPEPLRGRQFVVVEAAYLGDEQSGRELLAPLRALGPELDTFSVSPAITLTELHRDPPAPSAGTGNAWLLSGLDREAIDAVVATAALDGTSPLVSVEIRHLEGALGRPDPNGGALDRVAAPYVLFAVGVIGPQAPESIEARLVELGEAVQPWNAPVAFPNFAGRDTDPRAFYAEGVHDRLVDLKDTLDPDGLFAANGRIG